MWRPAQMSEENVETLKQSCQTPKDYERQHKKKSSRKTTVLEMHAEARRWLPRYDISPVTGLSISLDFSCPRLLTESRHIFRLFSGIARAASHLHQHLTCTRFNEDTCRGTSASTFPGTRSCNGRTIYLRGAYDGRQIHLAYPDAAY